jgi:hypothetical protein
MTEHLRETPQRRPTRLRRVQSTLVVMVVVTAGVVVVALGTGAKHARVSGTSTGSSTETAATSTTTGTTTATAAPEGSLAAVSSYWREIDRHDFAGAYSLLVPGAVPQTEAEWAAAEQRNGIESAKFDGRTLTNTATGSTVEVLSLITRDMRFGCRSWTGTYQMVSRGGRWLIARADITPAPCPSR